ncbi:hypothetical protein BC781_103353 [Sediminitomix flava]|uniref:Uncharacterized protein n=2 Tax=Sediminitomix flava TaxID=379075 RepID=A0A315ZAL9_SEDFL|nr:hypothetical protein BC781_103353 [Sediminitomix flava]
MISTLLSVILIFYSLVSLFIYPILSDTISLLLGVLGVMILSGIYLFPLFLSNYVWWNKNLILIKLEVIEISFLKYKKIKSVHMDLGKLAIIKKSGEKIELDMSEYDEVDTGILLTLILQHSL